MVFQARKWSWKRIAARVLLIPVLAGGSATIANAQTKMSSSNSTSGQSRAVDAKTILKEGRKALDQGRLDEARDCAQRAEASNTSGKWGLFDDTPNSLRKDIEVASAKVRKVESDQLTRKSKALFAKPTASEAERAANLDAAIAMARKADQLHGPYSVWDMGDRPDKMVKEIEAARAKIRSLPAANSTTASEISPSSVAKPAMKSGVAPAGGTSTAVMTSVPTSAPTAAVPDAKRASALKLMNEGKVCADSGDYAGAQAKYNQAMKVGASFSEREYNPGLALQDLNNRGALAIKRLIEESQTQVGKKDYAKADSALSEAGQIATALSLFPRPIEEAKANLRTASGGRFGGTVVAQAPAMPMTQAALPMAPAAPLSPTSPATLVSTSPPGVASVRGAANPPEAITPGAISTRQLLDQAAFEFKKGEFETAARLARQAHNLGAQEEASGLLNQIDVEVFAAKKRSAAKSLEAASVAVGNKDFSHAHGVLLLIDVNLLSPEQRAKCEELHALCKVEIAKNAASVSGGVATASGTVPPVGELQQIQPGENQPGTARIGSGMDPKTANPDNLANQTNAMRQVAYQKLRSEGLKVQDDAQKAFGAGDTDVAIQMLNDYSNRVRSANLDASSVALLLRSVDSRLEMYRVMKGQADSLAREKKEKREAKELIAGRGAADEQRKAEVQRLVKECRSLVHDGKYDQAERVALQAKQLEPDDAAIAMLATMIKMQKRVKYAENLKNNKEEFVLNGLNKAEEQGPLVDTNDPVAIRLDRYAIGRRRGTLDDVYQPTRTPAEYEINNKLDRPISLEFNQTPLSEAIENIRTMTALPVSFDTASITSENISTAMPISINLRGISTRNALHLILDNAGLDFAIDYETVRITTKAKVKGRLFTKVFSVADLVTPVPNFATPDYANFEKMLNKNALNSGQAMIKGLNMPGDGSTRNGLGGGELTGGVPGLPNNSPVGVASGMNSNRGGTLENNPLNGSSHMASDQSNKHEQLVRLITSMVRPYSWELNSPGSTGKIQYFDLGSALVVNQTADVIREVTDLLEALRRLQDLAVAVEVRIISLSESFFERMGVDFSMNITTHNTKFEPSFTTNQFAPEPYVNGLRGNGVTVGLTPAGSFTPDLAVPIKSTSYQYAIPGFGNYPNNPGADGGVSLGLAFLNDIQVYLFMEAAQGDRRVNVMQAPKLTLFNGQTATIGVNDLQFAVTNVQVYSVNGQIVFVPTNTVVPGAASGTINISLQAVVSADRRFVRINIPVTIAAQTGSTVPLFPVTTFITPVFEGGSQGVPIPFTQFLQQPAFTTLNIQTTVVCPDGGTVLLGGLKTLGESRNEFGPPFLSKIPYLNRLFKNVGIGRDTTHIMIMITPRIIINAEEEIIQTEGGGPAGSVPGR